MCLLMLAKVGSTQRVWVQISGEPAGVRQVNTPPGPHFFIDWTSLPLRRRLQGKGLCWKQKPRLHGCLSCQPVVAVLPHEGAFSPVLDKSVDTNKPPWNTCPELDISRYPGASPAVWGSEGLGCPGGRGSCSACHLGWNVSCRG